MHLPSMEMQCPVLKLSNPATRRLFTLYFDVIHEENYGRSTRMVQYHLQAKKTHSKFRPRTLSSAVTKCNTARLVLREINLTPNSCLVISQVCGNCSLCLYGTQV